MLLDHRSHDCCKMFPLIVQEIDYQDPSQLFSCFYKESWSILLDSSDVIACPSIINRYSYIAIDPVVKIICKDTILYHNHRKLICKDPLSYLKSQLQYCRMMRNPLYPPFQGGMVGYFSYDLCYYLESILNRPADDFEYPDLAVGIYDLVISFDHHRQQAWIISNGLSIDHQMTPQYTLATDKLYRVLRVLKNDYQVVLPTSERILPSQIATNFTQASYELAILKIKQYIRAGDIFEANMSQRFITPLPTSFSTFHLYCRLRAINPAPFSAYLNLDDLVIASASLERFLLLVNRHVESRPIKGTRPRGQYFAEDRKLAYELKNSLKDCSENTMIVDLMRNDLSKVCEDHSVIVSQLCGLESFATVHHLVSIIQGRLRSNYHAFDLLKATFPGGSITGAPKIRAMQIIAALEPNRRGPYCGSIGYIGFDGCMSLSITIRTYIIKNNYITFQVGGAIVLDSDPQEEYMETLYKAQALYNALVQSHV